MDKIFLDSEEHGYMGKFSSSEFGTMLKYRDSYENIHVENGEYCTV
jgi:hypothetical protein